MKQTSKYKLVSKTLFMLPTSAQWCSCMLIINFVFHKAFLFTLTMTCNKYIKYVSVNNGSIHLLLPDSLVSGSPADSPAGLMYYCTGWQLILPIIVQFILTFFQIVYVLCLSLLYYEFINVMSYMSYSPSTS